MPGSNVRKGPRYIWRFDDDYWPFIEFMQFGWSTHSRPLYTPEWDFTLGCQWNSRRPNHETMNCWFTSNTSLWFDLTRLGVHNDTKAGWKLRTGNLTAIASRSNDHKKSIVFCPMVLNIVLVFLSCQRVMTKESGAIGLHSSLLRASNSWKVKWEGSETEARRE